MLYKKYIKVSDNPLPFYDASHAHHCIPVGPNRLHSVDQVHWTQDGFWGLSMSRGHISVSVFTCELQCPTCYGRHTSTLRWMSKVTVRFAALSRHHAILFALAYPCCLCQLSTAPCVSGLTCIPPSTCFTISPPSHTFKMGIDGLWNVCMSFQTSLPVVKLRHHDV